MRRFRVPVRAALAVCLLALVLLAAAATVSGYLAEARSQSSDQARRLANGAVVAARPLLT